MAETEYRIVFQIQRQREGDEDFEEIGFGSSCSNGSVAAALYEVESIVDNYQWENEPGQPEPEEIKREQEARLDV